MRSSTVDASASVSNRSRRLASVSPKPFSSKRYSRSSRADRAKASEAARSLYFGQSLAPTMIASVVSALAILLRLLQCLDDRRDILALEVLRDDLAAGGLHD